MSTVTPPVAATATTATPTTPLEQEILLGHLSDNVRGRLAGDHASRKIIRQRRPGQELQLGVLPALPQPDVDSHETPAQLAQRINRPPSQIGVNFNLTPDAGQAAVDVAASFSFYVQRYPGSRSSARSPATSRRPTTPAMAPARPAARPPPGTATTAPPRRAPPAPRTSLRCGSAST